jgi:histidyl-tRNA synthetase
VATPGSEPVCPSGNQLAGQCRRARGPSQGADCYLEGFVDILDEDGKRRLYTNPLRVLDTKNPALQEMANNAPRLSDYLGEASRAHYEAGRR